MSAWIVTRSGRRIDFPTPDRESIDFNDIAEALAKTCRFNGHCRGFYSVAQHCVIAGRHMANLGRGLGIYGILHDAHEAYTGDIVRPMKEILAEHLKPIEEALDAVIYHVAGVTPPDEAIRFWIKQIDLRLLMTEKRDLVTDRGHMWSVHAEPYRHESITPWPWESAMTRWLTNFDYERKIHLEERTSWVQPTENA